MAETRGVAAGRGTGAVRPACTPCYGGGDAAPARKGPPPAVLRAEGVKECGVGGNPDRSNGFVGFFSSFEVFNVCSCQGLLKEKEKCCHGTERDQSFYRFQNWLKNRKQKAFVGCFTGWEMDCPVP